MKYWKFQGFCLLVWAPLLVGCLSGEGDDSGRLSMGLSMPLADFTEIRNVGLFAFSAIPPEFECPPYMASESDPFVEIPERLEAMNLIDLVPQGGEIDASLSGISEGDRTIIVECYDAGGSRIFLGCGQVTIAIGRSAELVIDMEEDVLSSDSR